MREIIIFILNLHVFLSKSWIRLEFFHKRVFHVIQTRVSISLLNKNCARSFSRNLKLTMISNEMSNLLLDFFSFQNKLSRCLIVFKSLFPNWFWYFPFSISNAIYMHVSFILVWWRLNLISWEEYVIPNMIPLIICSILFVKNHQLSENIVNIPLKPFYFILILIFYEVFY